MARGLSASFSLSEKARHRSLCTPADRRRYERQLIDARKQSDELKIALAERLRQERENAELREQFIAVLGHDLRNSLASVAAGARLHVEDQDGQ